MSNVLFNERLKFLSKMNSFEVNILPFKKKNYQSYLTLDVLNCVKHYLSNVIHNNKQFIITVSRIKKIVNLID